MIWTLIKGAIGFVTKSGAAQVAAAVLGGSLVLSGAYGLGDLHGRSIANANCKAAALQSQLDAAKKDLEEQQHSAADAATRSAQLESSAAALEEKVRAYEHELQTVAVAVGEPSKPAPISRCALDSRDVQRLRNIR
jgi:septal ring factor EnvC (AmiA/AmiB activator)